MNKREITKLLLPFHEDIKLKFFLKNEEMVVKSSEYVLPKGNLYAFIRIEINKK